MTPDKVRALPIGARVRIAVTESTAGVAGRTAVVVGPGTEDCDVTCRVETTGRTLGFYAREIGGELHSVDAADLPAPRWREEALR